MRAARPHPLLHFSTDGLGQCLAAVLWATHVPLRNHFSVKTHFPPRLRFCSLISTIMPAQNPELVKALAVGGSLC